MIERQGRLLPQGPRLILRVLDTAVLASICALGFLLVLRTGLRGFFPFDQSIVFDGSYRVASGQIPYKDFVMPFGPVTFWLHALFFEALGVTYFAYVVGAATINALAVIMSIAAVRHLVPPGRLLSYVAGALTAVWFYPPFGTPWMDQTAFFFSYLGILIVVIAIGLPPASSRSRAVLLAISGAASLLAIMSKQNAGLYMFPIYLLLLAIASFPEWRVALSRLGFFLAGTAAAAASFLVWLLGVSSFTRFDHYVLGVASELGRQRLAGFAKTGFGLARPFFGARAPLSVNLIAIGSLSTVLAVLLMRSARGHPKAAGDQRTVLTGVACIYLVVFQHLFMNTTLNQQENAYPFIGLVLAIAAGLALGAAGPTASRERDSKLKRRRARALQAAIWTLVGVGLAFAVSDGIRVGMTRKVQDIFSGARFDRRVDSEGLRHLLWADPMRIHGRVISERNLANLVAYLRMRRENFFVFPDFTVLYGVVGVPSPQPLLWFHEGVTYPAGGVPELDGWIVRELKKNRVRLVVIEQVSWFDTQRRLNAFPRLREHIASNFRWLGRIGIFGIWEERASETSDTGTATASEFPTGPVLAGSGTAK